MIDFSKGGAFDLKKVPNNTMVPDVQSLLINGESIVGVYQSLRDQVVFTNKRVITVDVKGISGKRKEYFSMPYSKIQYFGIQTAGLVELIPDTELKLCFSNGMTADFEFHGSSDILEIGKLISTYIL